MKKTEFKKGFTLVEMLVTLSIIVFMSGLLIVYTRNGEKLGQLNRGNERLNFDVRRMASMSMQTKQVRDKDGELRDVCGWGIYFNTEEDNTYTIFSDYCLLDPADPEGIRVLDSGSRLYEEGEEQETIKLGQNVSIITDLDEGIGSFVYAPPQPQLYIFDRDETKISEGRIILNVGGNNQKEITLTESGNFIIK